MKVMVVGVVALVSAMAQGRGDRFRNWAGRSTDDREAQFTQVVDGRDERGLSAGMTREEQERAAATSTTSALGAGGVVELRGADGERSPPAAHGWEIACENKSGNALVFDRGSVREYGAMTLFRWSAHKTERLASAARDGIPIYTAVADCRRKSIEPAWPGRSRDTRAGTCGRSLVEAVCSAAEQALAPTIEQGRGAARR
jgi:hypothetical protein